MYTEETKGTQIQRSTDANANPAPNPEAREYLTHFEAKGILQSHPSCLFRIICVNDSTSPFHRHSAISIDFHFARSDNGGIFVASFPFIAWVSGRVCRRPKSFATVGSKSYQIQRSKIIEETLRTPETIKTIVSLRNLPLRPVQLLNS